MILKKNKKYYYTITTTIHNLFYNFLFLHFYLHFVTFYTKERNKRHNISVKRVLIQYNQIKIISYLKTKRDKINAK